jgi:hypothetical protein
LLFTKIFNLFKDEYCIDKNPNLNHNNSNYKYESMNDCPNQAGAQVTLIIYVIYVVILNILLINLLIAIFRYLVLLLSIYFMFLALKYFSNKYEQVQARSAEIWKFQRYSVIYEYYHKPILSPPFTLISYFISIMRIFLRPIRQNFTNIERGEEHIFKRLFYYLSKEWRIKLGIFGCCL